MLSPSDYNSAVAPFENGVYARTPINPLYVEEPSSVDYSRGVEPLQTLPAQWWNWFANQFTNKFNKLNIYVKNIFNELAQLLSLMNVTPDGTEADPTTGQLKNAFDTLYPNLIATKLGNPVPSARKINGHALSSDVTLTTADIGAQPAGSYVPSSRTVNNKALSSDISLTYADVGAQVAGSYKTTQTPYSNPAASGSTTEFIDTISQNANGEVTVTKKSVSFPASDVTSVCGKTGAVTLSASDVGAQPAGSYVPSTRTVNGKALSTDISLTASDVGAAPAGSYAPVPHTDTVGAYGIASTTNYGHVKIGSEISIDPWINKEQQVGTITTSPSTINTASSSQYHSLHILSYNVSYTQNNTNNPSFSVTFTGDVLLVAFGSINASSNSSYIYNKPLCSVSEGGSTTLSWSAQETGPSDWTITGTVICLAVGGAAYAKGVSTS